jgi:riboflavin kinase/FMN adenylyltransferase
MRLIRGLSQLEPFKNGCVLTIGNFDGLHLGHRAVIKKLAARGKELGLPVVIMIFEPQPL